MPGLEGTTLGRYHLQRRLGRGGMSEVYLAYDQLMHREVAVKIVSSSHTDYLERFHREAEAIGRMYHDHILPAFDYGDQEPWHYLVMPYIAYGTLRDRLENGPLTLEEAGEMLEQIASGLQYAHDAGIIHRDIKPSNILLRDDHYAYLADFGLAKVLEGTSDLTQSGTLMGTPEYMAPELAEGPATTSSDIYALAILLYQMVTGRVPFSAETPLAVYWKQLGEQPVPPSHLNPAIPHAIDRVILRALDKDPRRRYQTARELAQAYEDALNGVYMPSIEELQEDYKDSSRSSHPPYHSSNGPIGNEDEHFQAGYYSYPDKVVPHAQNQNAGTPFASTAPYENIAHHTPAQEGRLVLPGNPLHPPSAVPSKKDKVGRRSSGSGSLFRRNRASAATPTTLPQAASAQTATHEGTQSAYPSHSQHPQQRRRSGRRRRVSPVLVASLIGLFLLLIFAVLIALAINNPPASNIAGQNGQTATVPTNPTTSVTQPAQGNTSATAQATAIAGIALTVTSSSPLLSDDLASNRNGWPSDTSTCVFTGGTYHVIANSANFLQSCESSALSFDNAAVQVNVSLLSGDNAGLIFRINGSQFYDFEITSDGKFFFRRHISGANYDYLIPKTTSSAITSGSKNTLLVIANGSDFKLYINGIFVGEVTNSSYASGQIGFVAGTLAQTSSGEAAFSDLKVFRVP